MKTIAVMLCAAVLTACASAPPRPATERNALALANDAAVDKLLSVGTVPIDKRVPVLVATVVNIGAPSSRARFGRLISELVAARMAQQGYAVVDMKLRGDAYTRDGAGEPLLSREVRKLAQDHRAQVVVTGNYSLASGFVYLTLKAVSINDNGIIAAITYVLPVTEDSRALF